MNHLSAFGFSSAKKQLPEKANRFRLQVFQIFYLPMKQLSSRHKPESHRSTAPEIQQKTPATPHKKQKRLSWYELGQDSAICEVIVLLDSLITAQLPQAMEARSGFLK